MRNSLIIISILFVSAIQAQTTYYVDATGGDDNNSGTSEVTAWQTIEKINNQTFLPGDSMLFKRGEVWSGTRLYISDYSGTATSPIVYGAYGTAEKPVISSIIPQSHTWSDIGGNIWQADNPPTEHPERMLINGQEKLRANIQSELDGITYFWRYDNSTNDLYLYSTVDPNSFTIEYTFDFPVIVGFVSNIIIRDLDIQGGWTGIFINTLSKNIHLYNLNIGKYSREGLIVGSGSTTPSDFPENILVENCTFDAFFAFDYSSAGDYYGSSDRGCSDGFRAEELTNSKIRNCFFKNWGHASISLSGGDDMSVSNVSVHDNYMTSPDICYGGRLGISDAIQNELYYNQIINTSVQSQLNGQGNHIHHNIFSGTTSTPLTPEVIDAGIEIQSYTNTEIYGNIYEHNLIINTEGPAFRISGNNNEDVHDNVIRNNIFYNCGTVIDGEIVTVEDDLYAATYDNSFLNNLVYSNITFQPINFRGLLYDIDDFNALTGTNGYIIADNISNNPLFFDEGIEDYHLVCSSPCIDAGTETLATFDFEGNPIPFGETNPDIGIYEYQHDVILLDLSVFFEGPFNETGMNTDLNDIPLSQPYGTAPWNYSGTESVDTIPADVVDWVLLELRDTTDAALATGETVIARQAAFLLNDGSIVDTAGRDVRPCVFTAVNNNLFVVIYHRNHLGIMSANPLIESGGVYTYDFTTGNNQAYGSNAQKDLNGGVYGMFSADANADGTINSSDKTVWEGESGTNSYRSGDFNLDGQVENKDKNNLWLENKDIGSQVPE
jgi:hypothetical protein